MTEESLAAQAVLTESFLIVDWTSPVPLEDFFEPRSPELRFEDIRGCLDPSFGLRQTPYSACNLTRAQQAGREHWTACNEEILSASAVPPSD